MSKGISLRKAPNSLKRGCLCQCTLKVYVQGAKAELEETQRKVTTVGELTHKLCAHFVENEKTFRLEECLNIFKSFCEKVIQCKKV